MIVDCAHYVAGRRQHAGAIDLAEAARCAAGGDEGDFVWLGLSDPEPGLLEEVGRRFGLHELAIEDATHKHQRPKLEDYDDSYFAVLKTARYDQQLEAVEFGEIHVFVGHHYLITVRHGRGGELAEARHHAESRADLLALGPASGLWAVLDKVVDDYEPVVSGIDDDIEEVEENVFDDEIPAPTQRIYSLKREVIEFHRAVRPLLAPLEQLERDVQGRMPEELRRYFRDVSDHAKRVSEQVGSQRDLLTSAFEANLALASVGQSEVVKRISAVAAVIAVPTLISGIYGMNFEHMPELGWAVGYPLALSLMAILVVSLILYFRRIDWL